MQCKIVQYCAAPRRFLSCQGHSRFRRSEEVSRSSISRLTVCPATHDRRGGQGGNRESTALLPMSVPPCRGLSWLPEGADAPGASARTGVFRRTGKREKLQAVNQPCPRRKPGLAVPSMHSALCATPTVSLITLGTLFSTRSTGFRGTWPAGEWPAKACPGFRDIQQKGFKNERKPPWKSKAVRFSQRLLDVRPRFSDCDGEPAGPRVRPELLRLALEPRSSACS